jgi:hypothetical protein
MNCGSGDINGIVKGDFKATSNAKLNRANPSSIDAGPTNTGDRVQSNRTESLKISTDRQNVNGGSHV